GTAPASRDGHGRDVRRRAQGFLLCYQFLTASASAAASSCASPSGATSITTCLPNTRTRSPIANSGASSGTFCTSAKYAGEKAFTLITGRLLVERDSVHTLSWRVNVLFPALRTDSVLSRSPSLSSSQSDVTARCSDATFAASNCIAT